jgi:PKHD-type hydroxylase
MAKQITELDVEEIVTSPKKTRGKKAVIETTADPIIVNSANREPAKLPTVLKTDWFLGELETREQWCFASNIFSNEEMDQIIAIGENPELSCPMGEGTVYGKNEGVRSCQVSWINSSIDSNSWIFQKLTHAVNDINSKFFGFDLTNIDSLQFTKYIGDTSDHYGKHCDMLYKSFTTRKLSFSLMLSDPDSYVGGDFLIHTAEKPQKPSNTRGTIIFFPSYTLHEVTPVVAGVRYSLVGWCSGPAFK